MPGTAGWYAARTVRLAVFALIFMPLVAFASAPLALVRNAWDTLRGLLSLATWPLRALRRGG